MKKLSRTIEEIAKILPNNKYLLTRYVGSDEPDDLDLLVHSVDFNKVVKSFEKHKWIVSSHDNALGGRQSGYQKNLVKKERIKIDLHKDFTWRRKRYLDLNMLWQKKPLVEAFLIFINIIFEKTYIEKAEYNYIWKHKNEVFESDDFKNQALKYGWGNTFENFRRWNPKSHTSPIFLPVWLVLFSYFEKFDLVSFLYYIFFRVRFSINKTLPYD